MYARCEVSMIKPMIKRNVHNSNDNDDTTNNS